MLSSGFFAIAKVVENQQTDRYESERMGFFVGNPENPPPYYVRLGGFACGNYSIYYSVAANHYKRKT